MKKILTITAVSVLAATVNFLLFILFYCKLATPYLHEAQQSENADSIFFSTLPCFGIAALVSTMLIYYCSAKINKDKGGKLVGNEFPSPQSISSGLLI